ncbi:MAG: DUF4177 domain-containing protein [Deltaproteobacteria bacterium]|nr:MAG: DUF4177 domain-containing protein [Deltaproteobacteria bacterium]
MDRYKVVELTTVTDETLEKAINEWVGKGWSLNGIQFAMRETTRRPTMAFILFTKRIPENEEDPGKGE